MRNLPASHLTLVVGARPNFMKAAALLPPLKAAGFRVRLVHTGQHYDPSMSQVFFRQLRLPAPDRHLGVGKGPPALQVARILAGMSADLAGHRPDAVVVVGDVNSTLAAAMAASFAGVPLVHVEAGLRSFDRGMQEELNRIATDRLSDLLLTTCALDDRNLVAEGIPRGRIRRVGDVMIDTLLRCRAAAGREGAAALRRRGLRPGQYGMVTLHRPENVDSSARLSAVLAGIERVSRRLPLLFAVHPRTLLRLRGRRLPPGILTCDPLGYIEFLGLMDEAALVLTDSGSIQQETTVLGVPCLTLRDSTERPVTCTLGTNHLAGTDPAEVERWALRFLARPPRGHPIPLWDGRAGTRAGREIRAWLRRGPGPAVPPARRG